MTSHRRLRLLFGSLVPLALLEDASRTAPAEAAPSTTASPRPQLVCEASTDTWTRPPYDPLQGLKMTRAPSFLALVQPSWEYPRAVPPTSGTFAARLVGSAGWRCGGAHDERACEEALRTSLANVVLHSGSDTLSPRALIVQQGDAVQTLETWSALKALLGPIDTVSEAALVATLHDYRIECGVSSVEARGQSYRVLAMTGACDSKIGTHVLEVGRDASLKVVSESFQTLTHECNYGRRPLGYEDVGLASDATLHQTLVRAMQLEHASVSAFVQIAWMLRRLHAPRSLVWRACSAAHDEQRHTSMLRELVARYGAVPELAPVTTRPFTDRYELALANATEGCVHEAFAALLAWEQAWRAKDHRIGEVMRVIAADETRHAALSWDLAAWLQPQLSERQSARLRQAQDRALGRLRSEWDVPFASSLYELAGMPEPARGVALVDGFTAGFDQLRAAA